MLVWVRQGSDGWGCSSRIPLQLPCLSCPVVLLYLLVSLRLSEMLFPAAFPICAYETGTLLQQVSWALHFLSELTLTLKEQLHRAK